MKKSLSGFLAVLLLLCCAFTAFAEADAVTEEEEIHNKVRYLVEFSLIPAMLEGYEADFYSNLRADGPAFLLRLYQRVYEDESFACPYVEADFSVEEKTVDGIEVMTLELPEHHLMTPMCARMYLLRDPESGRLQCFTVEMAILGEYCLGSQYPVMHVNYGVCDPETAEEMALAAFLEE